MLILVAVKCLDMALVLLHQDMQHAVCAFLHLQASGKHPPVLLQQAQRVGGAVKTLFNLDQAVIYHQVSALADGVSAAVRLAPRADITFSKLMMQKISYVMFYQNKVRCQR